MLNTQHTTGRIKYRVVSIYAFVLFLGGLVYLLSFILESDNQTFAFLNIKLIAGVLLLCCSYLLRASVNRKTANDAKAIAVFVFLFLFIMSLSFTPTDPSKVGIVRYIGLLTLITVIPLYSSWKQALGIFVLIILLQTIRIYLILAYNIDIPVAPNSNLWYTSIFSFSLFFLVWTINAIKKSYEKLIKEYEITSAKLAARKAEVDQQDQVIKHNIMTMAEIYNTDISACEKYANDAQHSLKDTSQELASFITKSSQILTKVDEHIRRINDLSYTSEQLKTK